MYEELAARLRQLRDLTGRSLRELARDVDASSSSLSRYFTGQALPAWPTVVALCRAADRDPRPLRELWERAKAGPDPAVVPAVVPVRNELPHDVTPFVGRSTELTALRAAAADGTLVAIDGMGGVGKSALAVHAAHLLTADFPDGQLYLDLHGFTPGREPLGAGEALRVLLTALGVPPGRIPDGVTERAALWRSELAPRRVLVLLDNAAGEDHVRDLLPGAGPSFALITSRRRMIALDGVHPISLDVLPPLDASRLFAASADGTRPGDLGEVLRRCGNLPLAIRVAAARLRHRPAWTLDTLLERLGGGELVGSGVVEMSLRQLDTAQRGMFGLLGLVPGEDIDAYGAAALAGIPLTNARILLEDLVDVHLVQEPSAGRYRMHDLLRQAARTEFGAAGATPAIARLGDYYLSGMLAAKERLGTLLTLPATVTHQPPALPTLTGHDAAVDWLDIEWANLTATFAPAVELGIDGPAAGIGLLASLTHGGRGSTAQLGHWLEQSRPAAVRIGDRRLLAAHRYLLGAVRLRVGRLTDAATELTAARELMAADGDGIGETFALSQLAEIRLVLDDPDGAIDLFRQAAALRHTSEALGVRVSAGLGRALVRAGRPAEARATITEVLETARDLDRQTERMCLDVLGWAALAEGDARTALAFAEQALELSRPARAAIFDAAALTDVAIALRYLGRPAEADTRHTEGVRTLERAGEPSELARNLSRYGQACLATGDPAAAEPHLRAAREIATAHGLHHLSRPVPGQRAAP